MSDSQRVEIAGESLRCKHCEADEFHEVSATLDRIALGGLLHLEGAWGHRATIYACARCGFVHMFFLVDSIDHRRREAEEAVQCLSCGASMPSMVSSCPSCGWTWETEEPSPS